MRAVSSPHPAFPPVGTTPVVDVAVTVHGVERRLRLKLESHNPHGSLKDRIAVFLIEDVADRIDKDIGIIESTSGNLGVAMAAECQGRGIPFNAVVDPRTSSFFVDRIRDLGARVTVVDEPDSSGGYLLNRIRHVREQLRTRPGLVWTNQYRSEANPRAHFATTAPEIRRQVPGPATLLVPVSTGGTLAGLARYVDETDVPWTLVGVDVHGSAALGGAPPGGGCCPGSGPAARRTSCPPTERRSATSMSATRSRPACGCPSTPGSGSAAAPEPPSPPHCGCSARTRTRTSWSVCAPTARTGT